MPNRKITDKCNHCGTKNHLRAHFCNHCGEKLQDDRAPKGADGKQKLYADIVHPIHSACREEISTTVLSAYQAAVRRQMELARITFNGPHVVDIQQLSDDQCEQEDP